MKYCKKLKTLSEKDEYMENWEGQPRPTVCLVEEDNKCYFDGRHFKLTSYGEYTTVTFSKQAIKEDDIDKSLSISIDCQYRLDRFDVTMGGVSVANQYETEESQTDHRRFFIPEVTGDIHAWGIH